VVDDGGHRQQRLARGGLTPSVNRNVIFLCSLRFNTGKIKTAPFDTI